MKIQIASDLHFEFGDKEYKSSIIKKLAEAKSDVLVLAGDICSRKNIFETLKDFSNSFESIVYVTGNHEHYGTHINQIRDIRNDVLNLFSNVSWLDNSSCEIQGQKFIGCTLWFPYDPMNQIYENLMNDFYSIHNFREWVYKENEYSVKYLNRNVDSNSIVITHHLPSYKCVHEKFKDSELNRFFVCDMTQLIEEESPKFFIFGHTHFKFDFEISKTRLVSNPLGYPGEHKSSEEFNFAKIIEI